MQRGSVLKDPQKRSAAQSWLLGAKTIPCSHSLRYSREPGSQKLGLGAGPCALFHFEPKLLVANKVNVSAKTRWLFLLEQKGLLFRSKGA
jgi:hypothetical protein